MKYQEYIDNELIKVVFDKQMLEEFTGFSVDNPQEYFKRHPRAKKPPFENLWGKKRLGMLPSWNRFLNVKDRVMQNNMKQHIADYTTYCLNRQKVKHTYLEECIVLAIQYKPDRSKSDNDNVYCKSSMDALTKFELWKDDNYRHVRVFTSFSVYEPKEPRTELLIFPIYKGECGFVEVAEYLSKYLSELESKYPN